MEKTHNLEVPGSSPGWSTKKRIAQMAVLFVLRAWTFTAGYLLRSWLAPTTFTPHNDAARTFLRFIPFRILCLFEILYKKSIEKHK